MSDKLLGSFVWCELLTTDTDAAGNFYKKVVGWKTEPVWRRLELYRLQRPAPAVWAA